MTREGAGGRSWGRRRLGPAWLALHTCSQAAEHKVAQHSCRPRVTWGTHLLRDPAGGRAGAPRWRPATQLHLLASELEMATVL